MKKNRLVSACLLGEPTRYDGKSKPTAEVLSLREKYNLVPVCPEVLGGLPTPRTPSERVGERVIMRDGCDVTDNFHLGAQRALDICKENNCEFAVLKARSPSCGKSEIYDGSFSGTLKEGEGVFAELLREGGVEIFSEEEIEKLLTKSTL